jgi:hypothetical protein
VLEAKFVGRSRVIDIALTTVDAKDLPVVALGDSDMLKQGTGSWRSEIPSDTLSYGHCRHRFRVRHATVRVQQQIAADFSLREN